MKHLYIFLIVSFCSSLLSCTNDDSFLAHDFETQQNRALSIYTGNYNIYQIAKKGVITIGFHNQIKLSNNKLL